VLDGDPPSSPTERAVGTAAPPTFLPMSIVAKRLPTSATAELLLRFSELFVKSHNFFLSNMYLASLTAVTATGITLRSLASDKLESSPGHCALLA